MKNLKRPTKEFYTEAEAAAALGISISRLYQLLDQYIFTDENRPADAMKFNTSDLVLLNFWNKNSDPSSRRVLQMPKRK